MYIHSNVPVYDRLTIMLVRFLRPRQPRPTLAGFGTGMDRKRDKEGSLREDLHPLPRYRSISTRLAPSHNVETIEAQAKALLEHIQVSRRKGKGGGGGRRRKEKKRKRKKERKTLKGRPPAMGPNGASSGQTSGAADLGQVSMWRLRGQVRFFYLLSAVDTRGGRCLARLLRLAVRRIGVVSIKTGTRNMWNTTR